MSHKLVIICRNLNKSGMFEAFNLKFGNIFVLDNTSC